MDALIDFFNSDLKFIDAAKQNWTQKSFRYIDVSRPNYGIMLVMNGRIDYIANGKTVQAKPGDLLFLPQDSRYEAIFHINSSNVYDYLVNFEVTNPISSFTTPTKIGEGLECAYLFEQLIGGYFSVNRTKNYLKGLFYLLIDKIVVKCIKNQSVNPLIDKAQRLLADKSGMSIKEIARQCSVSESGLRKMFKDNVGISPVKYRINVQINKAKYLIESTDMSIEEISDAIGFYDVAHFCKIFRSRVGISPKKYSLSKKL